MAHKTLTISEDAYDALSRLRYERESFTEVTLRLAKKKEIGSPL
ncbi:MAG: antitoxin VapB family protein [Nitrososphaerales archaeon]